MANNITKSKNKLSSIPKLLKYCAAALSVVSFLTTMHGIKNLIVDDELKAGMISFAVQGIILLLGLSCMVVIKCWKCHKEIKIIYSDLVQTPHMDNIE